MDINRIHFWACENGNTKRKHELWRGKEEKAKEASALQHDQTSLVQARFELILCDLRFDSDVSRKPRQAIVVYIVYPSGFMLMMPASRLMHREIESQAANQSEYINRAMTR